MAQPGHIGRYVIRREIGSGAMGVVYEALDPVLERTVAIKTIQIGLGSDETARYEERFLLEARAAGGLNHPNIVTIYDVGRSAEGAYICMELLEGRELREIMASNGLTLQRALEIAAQVADGLAYAHERGVVHRDIKPANIMVLAGDRVKIADFGIARKRTSEAGTQSEVVLGSPSYLSPEQALGKPCDGRSDTFSLGVILYQLASGRLPFRSGDLSELLHQIVHAQPSAPSAVNPAVPVMLDRIVAKALAKDADGRYASATELALDLRACREQVQSRPGTPLHVPAGEESASITTELLATELSRTDELDVPLAADAFPLHGLAKQFDSSEAVLRFATCEGAPPVGDAEWGQSAALAGECVAASAEPETQYVAAQGRAQQWSQRERITFFGAVAVALALGAAIVLR